MATIDPILIPKLRKMMPKLVAEELVSVQPMGDPLAPNIDLPDHIISAVNNTALILKGKIYKCFNSDMSNLIRIEGWDEGTKIFSRKEYLDMIKEHKEENPEMYDFIFNQNVEYLI